VTPAKRAKRPARPFSRLGPLAESFWRHGRCDDCPVIDMHGHMGRWKAIYFPRAAAEAMVHTMDQCGVRLLVFCHHAALFCPDIGNAANVQAVRRFPDRLRAYVGINPHYGEAMAADLAGFDEHRDVFVGLKLLASYHKVAWDSPAYEPAWRFADERGLLVLGHTWGGSSFDGPEQVRKAAAQYPNVRLLLGHSLGGAWDEAVAIAGEFPNVYLELTAVLDDRGAMEKFVAAGLSQKLLFGTDLPWFDPHHGIGAVLSAEITDDDRHNILHRNAERLLAEVGVSV
jgi:predicted TIM-barrel fold metal-dependent hydrolase